ncbi:MAG: C25 family cysteine peptidase [bacterium]|nr:C25 family cysteine peptidase [bacterium]
MSFFLSIVSLILGLPAKQPNLENVVKIFVDEDGLYRITYFDLLDAGINPLEINPTKIRLTNRGKCIPVYFSAGTTKSSQWNKNDYLEFYGTFNRGSTAYYDEYTDTNVYFLHWTNPNLSPQWYRVIGKPQSKWNGIIKAQSEIDYLNKIHREEKFIHSRWVNIDAAERWFWMELAAPTKKKLLFTVPSLSSDTTKQCSVRIKFFGVSRLPQNPDHYVVISLNGYPLGEIRWDGATEFLYTNDSVPIGYFKVGSNSLEISLPGKEGDPKHLASEIDVVFLSWFEIDCWQQLVATNNDIQFQLSDKDLQHTFPSGLRIKNFTYPNICIYNLSNTTKYEPIVIPKLGLLKQTTYFAYFEPEKADLPQSYFACTENRIKTPFRIEKQWIGKWRNPEISAEYIIISPSEFNEILKPLVELRKQQGLLAELVNIEDIYNEFNFGIINPQAIRDFLFYAYHHWKSPRLKYVLLVGDASWDMKGSLNLAEGRTYIPMHYFASSAGYAASDNWYVCLEGEDSIPELAIGRIPSHSVSETEAVINKILEYELQAEFGPWRQSVLFLATPREWTDQINLELMKHVVPNQMNSLPRYATPETIESVVITPQNVIEWFNEGAWLVHFTGHASPFHLDVGRPGEEGQPETVGYKDRGFFGVRHITKLQNKKKYPLVILMTCYANEFDSMWSDGIGEALLKVDKAGAIACVGGTYRVSQASFEMFDKAFLRRIFQSTTPIRLGDAFLDAKREVNNEEINNLYTLLGDPGLLISIPEPIPCKIERIETTTSDLGIISVTDGSGMWANEFTRGIIQLRTQSGDLISSFLVPNNQMKWNAQFAISGAYRTIPLVITINLWNEYSKRFAAARELVAPVTPHYNEADPKTEE